MIKEKTDFAKKAILLVFVIVLLCGCGNEKKEKLTLKTIVERGNYTIVDVRTAEEYEEGHIAGALNLPYDEIDGNVELEKDKTIIVYCRSGARSKIARARLQKLGYEVFDAGAYDNIDLEKE